MELVLLAATLMLALALAATEVVSTIWENTGQTQTTKCSSLEISSKI